MASVWPKSDTPHPPPRLLIRFTPVSYTHLDVYKRQALGFNPGIADRKRTGSVYWIDIDLKPTDSLLNPADLQGEAGRIVRLEVKGCPGAPGAQ